MLLQGLGLPITTLEAGIAAGSFFPDGNKQKQVGNAQAAMANAKNVIAGAR